MSRDIPALDLDGLQLFRDLVTAVNFKHDHKSVVRVCQQVLGYEESSIMTLFLQERPLLVVSIYEIYITALLHIGEYVKVLEVLSSNDKSLSTHSKSNSSKTSAPSSKTSHRFFCDLDESRVSILRSYAHYRCGEYSQAASSSSLKHKNGAEAVQDNSAVQLILAQSWFHIGQTEKALECFLSLVSRTTFTGNDDSDRKHANEEKVQLLTNAIACLIASATPYCHKRYEELEKEVNRCLEMAEENVYPYDLAFNLATWKLVSGQINDANRNYSYMDLLQRAVNECRSQNLNNNGDAGANGDNDATAAALEVSPLITNFYLFDEAFWNPNVIPKVPTESVNNIIVALPDAVRTVHQVNTLSLGSSPSSKEVLKLLMSDPTEKLTPLQCRIWYYNRSVFQFRSGMYDECKSTCQWLESAMQPLSSHQRQKLPPSKKKMNGSSEINTTTKTTTSSSWNQSILAIYDKDDFVWWESRLTVLASYCQLMLNPKSTNEEKKGENGMKREVHSLNELESIISKLKDLPPTTTIIHSLVYALLHRFQIKTKLHGSTTDDKVQLAISMLENDFPACLRTKPAVVATLAYLYQISGQQEESKRVLLSASDKRAMAHFTMAQGRYEDAVALYEKDLSSSDSMDSISVAYLVKGLSYTDPARAQELWSQLQKNLDNFFHFDNGEDYEAIGIELEAKELPRIKSTKLSKSNYDVIFGENVDKTNEKKKKSREAVLRRRAKKREMYVAELQRKGVYNPDHPSKPDPERWLPKYERSYNRRRRNNNSNNNGVSRGGIHKGAQGGISDKDAAKLDVVARQQQARDAVGPTVGSTVKSTAHMTVVGSGPSIRRNKGNKK